MSANLDWLHIEVKDAKWKCTKRAAPREWELEVPFVFIGHNGTKRVEALCVYVRDDPKDPSLKKGFKLFFAEARNFLHGMVLRMSIEGAVDNRPFRAIMPANIEFNPGSHDFCMVYELEEPDEFHPGVWVLRHKDTRLAVRFTVAAGANRNESREAVRDAMTRMHGLLQATGKARRRAAHGLVLA